MSAQHCIGMSLRCHVNALVCQTIKIFRFPILGYRKGEDGEPEIVPEEAEIVLKIYNLYLSGYSVKQINSVSVNTMTL